MSFKSIVFAKENTVDFNEFKRNLVQYDKSGVVTEYKDNESSDKIINKIIEISKNYIFKETEKTWMLLIKVIIICFLSSLIKIYVSDSSLADIAFYACYCLVAYIMINSFKTVSQLCSESISTLTEFIKFSIPTYATTLAMTGYTASATSVQGLFLGIGVTITHIINSFIIPLLYCCGLVAVVGSVSTVIDLSKIISVISKTIKYSMGIIMTVFAGALTFSGLANASADNLAIKTAKYAVANFVPVVGGCLSEALHSVINSSVVLKNSMGYLCYLVIISICLFPVIKIAVIIFIIRITAALSGFFSENKVGTMINSLGDVISTMLGLLLLTIVMFVLVIGVIASTG